MNTPPIVSAKEWEDAWQELLVKEKEFTRARDELAARRRRMPWVAVEKDYVFEGPEGGGQPGGSLPGPAPASGCGPLPGPHLDCASIDLLKRTGETMAEVLLFHHAQGLTAVLVLQ